MDYIFNPILNQIITQEREKNNMTIKFNTKISLTAEQICNSKDTSVLLVTVREGAEYMNGKPTGNIDHHKYDVVLPHNYFEKITVKIKDDAIITQEQLD